MSISESREADGPPTLADRLDGLVLRLELWRPRAAVLVACTVVAAVVVGWVVLRPSAAAPVEDAIPMVDAATASAGGGEPGGVSASDAGSATGQDSGSGASDRVAGAGSGTGATGGSDETSGADEQSGDSPSASTEKLVVHVAGAVRRPGLVLLEPGSRISDAVTAAGGPSAGADVHRLNLAAPVSDGMQVRVPTLDEEVEPGALLSYPADDGPEGPGGDVIVDINTADTNRLQTLPGVGPAIAGAIIAWRDEQGRFRSVDELQSVPGIGPAKLAGLRDHVTI